MSTIETTADGESGNSGGDTADTSTTSAPEMPDSEAADKPETEITAGAEATGSEVVTTDEYSSVKPEDELTTTDDGNAGSETETNTQANKDVAEVQKAGEFKIFAESNEGAKDIGNLVDQSGVTLSIISGSSETKIIDNGHPVEGAPEIKVGDKIKLSYEGNISPESMEQINAGDHFTIQLPDTEYISTIEGTYDLKTEDGEVYATYTIANGALKVTLTEVGASQSEIDDEWIQITGSAIKSGDNVVISTNGNVPITINIKPGSGGSGGGGGNDAGQTEIPDGKITFTKDGKQYDGKDILNWHLNVNYDGLRQMVSGENVSRKNKVILVDTLPDEVAVDMGSIYITAPIFVPTPDGKMSGYSIGYLRVTPTVLYAEDGESYEHFYQRVNTFSSLSVGVYENKILFGFGNLPGNGVAYDSNYIDSLVASHVSSGDITEAQGNRLKEVYGSEGSTEGQIVGYDVSYDTNVTGDSGDYTNTAQLLWNTDDEKDAQYTIAYNSTSGGASSRINVTVNKVWNDRENKDGLRPDQITIQLYADEEEKGEPVTVIPDADGNWNYRWTRLPKNQNGHAIEYTAKEINIPDGYVSESVKNADGSITITNTHTPETPAEDKTTVSVKKNWIGPEGDSVTVHLLADGIDTGKTLKLTKDSAWSGTFEGLRVYSETGEKIAYTVSEDPVSNYTSEITEDAENEFTITNTSVATTKVKVTKKWVGTALDSATVGLLADGELKESIALNADKNWTYTFQNLPKYDSTDGHEIAYTVSEEPAENYSTAITGTAADGYTITNTITGKESIPVTKKWLGSAADSVTVKLMNGDTEVASQVLNAGNHWQYTFTDVDKYDAAGNEIQYTVKEDAVNRYSASITGNISDGFVITNYNTERISIPVTKNWVGETADQAEVDLKDENGKVVDSAALTKENGWKATFSDLPKYDSTDGHEIRYTLSEKPMANYNTVVTGDTATGFTVTNTVTGKVSVGVTKKWIGPDAGSATVRLKDGETEIDSAVLNADNNWQHTFSDLDQYDEEGKEIDYTISEDAISGYDTSIVESTPNGFTVTNTNLEKTSVDVEKRWVGPVKDQVTVTLLSDGTEKQSAVLTAESNWKTSFTDLPKYDSADGHEISYTVSESPVDGYSSAISGTAKDGYTITNTITGKISIPVTKVWAGGTGDKAVVHLFADGIEIESLELNSSNKWQHTFENLDQYKDGEEIRYTLTEDSVSGYSTTITYSQDKGFTVTNSKNGGGNHGGGHDHDHPNNPTTPTNPNTPGSPTSPGTPTSPSMPSDGTTTITTNTPTAPGSAATQSGTIRSPQTGDNSHMVLYLLLMIGSIVALISDLIILKKHKGATR